MKTFVGLDNLEAPSEGTAVTIGTFDGVHVGHRALIAATIARARALDAAAAGITWDRHPNQTLRPERTPPLLTSQERKVELLEESGLDLLVVLAFDRELSRWPPERFVSDAVVKALGARAVVVGPGWRFGHKAAGDAALLRALGADLGFEVEAVEAAEAEGDIVSSSRIRAAVADGDMELARSLLGRPFDLDGVVVRGDDRGRALGFPTANLVPDPALAAPAIGVYGGRAKAAGAWYGAAVNIGVNPTFGGDAATTSPRVEAYLLDFEGDLYGDTIRVELWKRLRDERKFASADDLVAQIARDVEETRLLTC